MIEHNPQSTKAAAGLIKDFYKLSRKTKKPNQLVLLGYGGIKNEIDITSAKQIIYTTKLDKIINHDKNESVLVVEAGLSFDKLKAKLAKSNQMLPFDPPNYSFVRSGKLIPQSIGGIVSSNLNGSLELSLGGIRNYVLGLEVINGKGEIMKFGSCVLKNVTGYDISKLFVGSRGRLGLILSLNFRLLTKPEDKSTLIIPEKNLENVSKIFTKLLKLPLNISSACFMPKEFSQSLGLSHSNILISLEGSRQSIKYRFDKISKLVKVKSFVDCITGEEMWQKINNLTPFKEYKYIWQITLPASEFSKYLSSFKNSYQFVVNNGGTKIFIACDDDFNNQTELCDNLANIEGSSISLIKAPLLEKQIFTKSLKKDRVRSMVAEKVYSAFDPGGIFFNGF